MVFCDQPPSTQISRAIVIKASAAAINSLDSCQVIRIFDVICLVGRCSKHPNDPGFDSGGTPEIGVTVLGRVNLQEIARGFSNVHRIHSENHGDNRRFCEYGARLSPVHVVHIICAIDRFSLA